MPWWLAGIGAADAQATGAHSEAVEHGWQGTDAEPSGVPPFVVMLAPHAHAGGRPRGTVLFDPASKPQRRNPAALPCLPVSHSFAKSSASGSPKRAPTLAARFKSLRSHGVYGCGDESEVVYARVDSRPPSVSPTSPTRRPSILRTLRKEVKVISGRMHRDSGRVTEGRCISRGEPASGHVDSLEGSEHGDAGTGLDKFEYTRRYLRL
jgi:hypothetical protein